MSDPDVHPRAARYRLERCRDLLSHLRLARMSMLSLGEDPSSLDDLISVSSIELSRLTTRAGERIEPRKRAKQPLSGVIAREEFFLFLDECGSHVSSPGNSAFPIFCLCGIVVSKDIYQDLDRRWKAWKAEYLGDPNVVVHEPDIRSKRGKFRGSSKDHAAEIEKSLNQFLDEINLQCIASVVDFRCFEQLYPNSVVDDFLPRSCYLMSIDFVLERFLHFLQSRGNGAQGIVVAESRGLREDAQVHAEFIRLHLEGTQFVSDSSFRYHLRPYIEFFRKSRNNTGLQIADLAARPLAEKILDSRQVPARWDTVAAKLYDGMEGSPHKYGLKVFPLTKTNDPFPHLPRKAKGDA